MFFLRNVLQRPLEYDEHDENLQEIERAYLEALQARDVAILNSSIYATVAAGVAATNDGEYFTVPSPATSGYLDLYRNDAGVEEFVKRYPSVTYLETLGIGAASTASEFTDFDAIQLGGFHRSSVNNPSNAPVATAGFWICILVPVNGTNNCMQMAMGRNGVQVGMMWYRLKRSGAWDPWYKIPRFEDANTWSGKQTFSTDTIQISTSKTPASATAAGSTGDIAWDASYLYLCIATNTWRRIAHASW